MDKIVLVPYVRKDGIPTLRDSEIKDMYTRAYKEGWGKHIFYDGLLNTPEEFVQYVTDPYIMFWGIYSEADLMGFVYVNRIEKTNAHIHYAFFKKWWGTPELHAASRKALELLLVDEYNGKPLFEVINGMTPSYNKHAVNHMNTFGVHTVGKIPHLLWSEKSGKSMEGTVTYITREDLE